MRAILMSTALMGAATTWAHPGHGMPGFAHWPAAGPWGLAALALATGGWLWWTKGR